MKINENKKSRMFPEHCNKCFKWRRFEKNLELHASRCGHIFCKQCIQPNCPVCLRPVKSVPITNAMPPSMSHYFTEPMQFYKQFQRILRFHVGQECILVQHLIRVDRREATAKLRGFQKIQASLKANLERERERIQKLLNYVSYHERRLESAHYNRPATQLQPLQRYYWRKLDLRDSNNTKNQNTHALTQLQHTNKKVPPRTPTLSMGSCSENENSFNRSCQSKKSKASLK